jgi:hypothetical protein
MPKNGACEKWWECIVVIEKCATFVIELETGKIMTTIVKDNSDAQAKQFVKFARTLPFAKVERRKTKQQSEWDKAIAEGAVTPQEFHAMFEKEIRDNW